MSVPGNRALRDFIYGFGSDQVVVINIPQTAASYSDVRPGTYYGSEDWSSDFYASQYNWSVGFECNHEYDYPLTGQMIDWCGRLVMPLWACSCPRTGPSASMIT